MNIAENIAQIRSELQPNVTLVAVSKFHPVEVLREAYDAGQRVFGESRVQELQTKQSVLPADVEWHFIGTLQTNKVKFIAPFISMIQSIDTEKLLAEVDREAEKCHRSIRALIEVHIAEEATKHGFSIDECKALFAQDLQQKYPHVQISGLMGMATFTEDKEQVKREFHRLHALFDEVKSQPLIGANFTELSMGMSDDYSIAMAEGSTMVRIGTKIFGERKYNK